MAVKLGPDLLVTIVVVSYGKRSEPQSTHCGHNLRQRRIRPASATRMCTEASKQEGVNRGGGKPILTPGSTINVRRTLTADRHAFRNPLSCGARTDGHSFW